MSAETNSDITHPPQFLLNMARARDRGVGGT